MRNNQYRRALAAEVAQTVMTCGECHKDQPFKWTRWNSTEPCECGSTGFTFCYVKNSGFRIMGKSKPYMETTLPRFNNRHED